MGWSEESVNALRKMWAEGLTANEIAKKLGVTKNSIVGKVHRLCLKARPSPIKTKNVEIVQSQKEELPENENNGIYLESADLTAVKDNTKKNCKAGNIDLVDLDSHTCRWPLGDPRDDDFCFCGKKVRTGQTYCDEHSMMAYVKATKK